MKRRQYTDRPTRLDGAVQQPADSLSWVELPTTWRYDVMTDDVADDSESRQTLDADDMTSSLMTSTTWQTLDSHNRQIQVSK